MLTIVIRQYQESVCFISSTGRSYTVDLLRTCVEGDAPALPVVVEELAEDRYTATYEDGHEESFQSLAHFSSHHGCAINGFSENEAS